MYCIMERKYPFIFASIQFDIITFKSIHARVQYYSVVCCQSFKFKWQYPIIYFKQLAIEIDLNKLNTHEIEYISNKLAWSNVKYVVEWWLNTFSPDYTSSVKSTCLHRFFCFDSFVPILSLMFSIFSVISFCLLEANNIKYSLSVRKLHNSMVSKEAFCLKSSMMNCVIWTEPPDVHKNRVNCVSKMFDQKMTRG